MTQAIATRPEGTELATSERQPTVMEILSSAVLNGNVSVDVIERLARLQGEMADRDAKRAFAEAFAEFKKQVPAIVKDAKIEVKGTVRSKYAKLDQVAEKVIPVLLEVGITHRWKTRTADDGRIFVTCFLRHVLGHEEEGAQLASMPDTSGSMNALQGQGSTVSYLERYTFIASCGIVIKDQDDDGIGHEGIPHEKVQEWISAIEEATEFQDVKKIFGSAYTTCNELGDRRSLDKIIAAYEKRKVAILEPNQR